MPLNFVVLSFTPIKNIHAYIYCEREMLTNKVFFSILHIPGPTKLANGCRLQRSFCTQMRSIWHIAIVF